MEDVVISVRDPSRFESVIGTERSNDFMAVAGAATELLRGVSVLNVNSTAAGGGVAEMLHVLLSYVRGIGVDARWAVIEGSPEFFTLTKRIHNHLYGTDGDGGDLDEAAQRVYERTLASEVAELANRVQADDVVILHDPQTAGLAEAATKLGCRVVWRCHVGIDEPNEHSQRAWDFLRPHLEPFVDHYVFTDARFPPPWVPDDRCSIIWPSIDPFSPKNQPLSDEQVEAILSHVGVVAGREGDTSFVRTDGTPSRVERFCDVFRTGPPASARSPMVAQVSRWDSMKDMSGVMAAFEQVLESAPDAELVLAGPVVSAVADDPEGGEVLEACWEQWRQLPHSVRRRVQLVCLPMHDLEENAAIVNALQRHCEIVAQKSLAEGFGLTVAEAMLKGTAVIGSAVGGIVDQIIDGETGLLVDDPNDLDTFAAAVIRLLEDDDLRMRLGQGARQRAVEMHLGDVHLRQWVDVVAAVLGLPSPNGVSSAD